MKIKLLDGQLPTRKHIDDAGLDCYSAEAVRLSPGATWRVRLGFAVQLLPGMELQIRGRSSVSAQGILCHLGTVDAGYRGEVSAVLTNLSTATYHINRGDRIAQAVVAMYHPLPFEVVDALDDSDRGTGGFGSTGV